MGFSFLAPWFLAAVALVAIPIVVHLTRRERQAPVAFPSLMFLEATPHELERRRRLRDWPLLLLRALALALLALAFARPFVDRADAPVVPPGAGGREVVVLLDRSYSMGAAGRWARATNAARQVVDGLGRGDQATIVLFDAAAESAAPATGDRAALRLVLDSARVGSGVTRYTPALALAAQLLGASTLRTREAVLISDFQRSGWEADPEARLPAGTRLTTVDVGTDSLANVAVTAVELRQDVDGDGRERVAAAARVTSARGRGEQELTATLELGGRAVESRAVRVPPTGAVAVAFAPVLVPEGAIEGTVRAGSDELPADNSFHFTVSRGQVVRVLLVEGAGARPNSGLYLRRALEVGDRRPFRVDARRASALTAADLAGYAVVVLSDAPPRAAAARALVDFVRDGGGLVVALGEGSGPGAWAGEAAPLLPATPGGVVDRTGDGGARLASVERSHPVFAPFARPRSGDLGAARVLRYRGAGAEAPAVANVLARFDDGAPALVEHSLGRGRVLVWASTLDTYWNDLPVQPVFVPLVRQLAGYAARHADERPWLTVGETLDLSRTTADGADSTAAAGRAEWVVTPPEGRPVRVGVDGARPALGLTAQGFYRARPAGAATAPSAASRVVAVNVDPDEADLARVEPAEIVRAVEGGLVRGRTVAAADPASGPPAVVAADRERRQGTWWYVLAAAGTLLVAEAVLGNRLSRGRPGATSAVARR